MSVRRMIPLDTANINKNIQLCKKLLQKYKKKKNDEYIRSTVRRLFVEGLNVAFATVEKLMRLFVERLMRRRVEFSLKEGAFFFSFLYIHW